jgi:hypothetical protein
MLNCESSEAKRKCSIVEKIISKQSEHVYIEEFKYRSEANTFVSSNCESSEAKRTCWIVKKLFRSEANLFIFKNLNIEAKRRKLTLTCESSEVKRT